MAESKPQEQQQSTLSLIVSLPANFWYANLMEIFERLAFFGVRAIAPLYLVAKSGDNGLALTYTQKGTIYAVWALIQCLVPMVSGGYTERYGYRKTLTVAFFVNILGYLLMAQSRPLTDQLVGMGWLENGYWVFMAAACLIAFGTAVFKPPCHGTIAKTTDENTASMGWGLFYWIVNIGGALAPMAAAQLRGDIDWHYVFYGAAIVTAFNFLPLFILYREPEKTPKAEGEENENAFEVFFNSIFTVLRDIRLLIFLLIFSCFWLMFMQLWDLLPNFIDEWVDTSDVAPYFSMVSEGWVLPNGQAKPEMLINIDSLAIIALVLFISWLIRKINKVAAMIIGMIVALVGFVGTGATMLGWVCCVMIFIFAIGEMLCSPTFSAYIGLIAPKDKKALYMGYSNIPFAIGWAVGNLVGGYYYDHYAAKAELAMKYLSSDTQLIAEAAQAVDWSDSLQHIPKLLEIERDEASALVQQDMNLDAEATAETLRRQFHWDQGQIENLALLHLALAPQRRDKTEKGYAAVVQTLAERLTADAARYKKDVADEIDARTKPDSDKAGASTTPTTAPAPTTNPASAPSAKQVVELPAASDIVEDVEEISHHLALSAQLTRGELALEDIGLASLTHYLPTIVGTKRDEALDTVRDLMNEDRAAEEKLDNADVIAALWKAHGDDPAILNNLALEYLAQNTDRVRNAVENLDFHYPPEKVEERMAEITRRTGIGREKAFAALGAALRAKADGTRQTLPQPAEFDVSDDDAIFVYLAGQGEHRYQAVRQIDWRHNRALLRSLIRDDDNARELVIRKIDNLDIIGITVKFIRDLFGASEEEGEMTEEGINYHKLAAKQDLIQEALTVRDWSQRPELAAEVMRVNPFEARAAATSDAKLAKQKLWDKYDPYMVWIYLGAFGLAGTLGMILFYFATRRSMTNDAPTEEPAAA